MNKNRTEIEDGQKRLSKVNLDFLEFVENNPDALEAASFASLDLQDDLFVLQPWPTFVNRTSRDEFGEAAEKLFGLIKTLPKRIFGFDAKKMSTYYGLPESLIKLQLAGVTGEHIHHLVARGDFILGPAGLKCLEYNVSSNLGGWFVPIWQSLYLENPVISKFLTEYGVTVSDRNLIRQFLEHIIHSVPGKKIGENNQLNILFAVANLDEKTDYMGVYLNELYKTILRQKHPSLKGEIFLCHYNRLEIVDGYLYTSGKRISALVETFNGVVSPDVMKVFKAGKIRLMNGPITGLLSSKLNLALLSDYNAVPFNADVFTEEEKRIINKYVPWSRKVAPGYTTYGKENIKLEDFMLSNKDRLVIKPSIGYGGRGIYIGRRIPGTKWESLMKAAINQENWLVQEFVDPSPGLYQAGEKGCEPHDMVWGFFVLGSRYADAWVRVLPQNNNMGVINCHQGATVSIIFEVDE